MSKYGTAYATIPKSTMIGTSRGLAINKRQRSKLSQYAEDKPMKRTLKQKLRDWIFNDPEQEANFVSIDEGPDLDSRTSTRITVHQAVGGTIIQTRRYDERKDNNVENLYIIHKEADLGQELAKIITLEGLRS